MQRPILVLSLTKDEIQRQMELGAVEDRKDPPAKARATRSSAEAKNDAGSSEDRNCGLGTGASPRTSDGGGDDPDCEVF